MQYANLKEWLEQSDGANQWGLQVIIDALSSGENIPARLLDLNVIRDLYKHLIDSYHHLLASDSDLADAQREELLQDQQYFTTRFPHPLSFDNWVRFELPQLQEGTNKVFIPHRQVIHSLTKKAFITLTSNELPIEALIRIELVGWSWLLLLWLFHQHRQREFDGHGVDKIHSGAFGIPRFHVQLAHTSLNLHRNIEGVEDSDAIYLMLGPMVLGPESLFAEHDYELHTVTPIVKTFQRITERFRKEEVSFSRTRFNKAIRAEPSLPRKNEERRSRRIVDALSHLLTFQFRAKQELDAQCLRLMGFWSLCNTQRHDLITGMPGVTPTFQMDMLYEPDTNHDERMSAVFEAHHNRDGYQLVLAEEQVGTNWMLKAEDYGCNLNVSPDIPANREMLTEFAIKLGHSFLRQDQKTKLLEQKELLIFTEWLQGRIGTFFPQDDNRNNELIQRKHYQRSSEEICRWIAETMRADLCILFSYEDSAGRYGKLTPLNSYSYSLLTPSCRKQMEQDMLDIAGFPELRADSIAYRSVEKGTQQVCYAYNSETGIAIPSEQKLYRSPAIDKVCCNKPALPYKMVISTPIKFNNRLLGVIETSSSQAWRFRYNRQTGLKKIATALAPFIYQHEYLRALHDTQIGVLKFHSGDMDDKRELYKIVCKAMSRLFLSKGAALWIRDTTETNNFNCEGFFNTKCNNQKDQPISYNIHDPLFLSGKYILELSSKNICHVEEVKNQKIPSNSALSARHECLTAEGVKSLTFIPIFGKDESSTHIIAILNIYSNESAGYDKSWLGTVQFVSSHLSFIIEAVNAFTTERHATISIYTHDLWAEINTLASKASKIAKPNVYIRDKFNSILKFINDDWFRSKVELAHIEGVINKDEINKIYASYHHVKDEMHHNKLVEDDLGRALSNNIRSIKQEMEGNLFLPQEDMIHHIRYIKGSLDILFNGCHEKNNKEFEKIFLLSKDRDIAGLSRFIGQRQEIDFRRIYNSLMAGNRLRNRKGAFFEFNDYSQGKILHAPRPLINIIMLNLLTNADKYSSKNSYAYVEVSKRRDNWLSLTVVNEGDSMKSESEHRRMLGRGKRGSNAEHISGRGIGLFTVNQICRHILGVSFVFKEIRGRNNKSKYIAEISFPPQMLR